MSSIVSVVIFGCTGLRARHATRPQKVQFRVSSTPQAGADSAGLGVARLLLRDEESSGSAP